mmetsp:Transcript_18834/g.45504  ORF Transcript_18834/g.45504 Transcript_18834/m.45504 type:complete len:562 (-) Transcript_18834:31-1716(-)
MADTTTNESNNNKRDQTDQNKEQQQQERNGGAARREFTTIPPRFVPTPFPYHHVVTIKILKLTDLGWGVGVLTKQEDIDTVKDHREKIKNEPKKTDNKKEKRRKRDKDNEQKQQAYDDDTHTLGDVEWQVRVPNVLEGEIVEVKIFKNFDTYSEGDFVKVVGNVSEDRVPPKCPLAGVCAGCQFQHVNIDKQRQWKTEYVQRLVEEQKIEGFETISDKVISPTLGTDEVYEYRNKLTPHYEAPIRVGDGEQYELQAIGFQQMTTKRLVDVEDCPIATPAINKVYKETRAKLHRQASEGVLNNKKRRKKHRRSRHKVELGATLLFRQADNDETTGEPVVVTDHSQYMTTTVKGIKFRYLAGNFFQNNDYVVPLMADGVINAALQPVVDDSGTNTTNGIRYLIDCYCGSGLFALCASSKVNLCVGIEVNPKAAEEATDNAERNNIANCQFVAASAEAIFTSPPALTVPGYESTKIQDFPREETCVVLDPPRKGCSGQFLEQLYEYSPQRIVYMSCGPATQARDAKGIVEIGGYTITSIQPYDLFPMTKHVESLIVFEKKKTEA